ncbi:MAG: hypothetical protein U1E10_09025 [Bdellovibrionales bacterium]|nr:hypothetical protein [Bdellovibrionales bacterium]
MKPPGASSSPPAQFVGPDSRERYVGLVLSAAKISKSIGTSDISGEDREFLEIQMKVQNHSTLETVESETLKLPKTPVNAKAPPPEFKEIVQQVPPEMSVRFYFKPDEKLQVGDLLEVTTRSRRQISYGWVSGEHGATYRILKKQAK